MRILQTAILVLLVSIVTINAQINTIKVLFAHSQNAQETAIDLYGTTIDNIIEKWLSSLNTAFTLTGIDVQAVSAGNSTYIPKTSWVENGEKAKDPLTGIAYYSLGALTLDRNEFAAMSNIKTLRDQNKADICVLLVYGYEDYFNDADPTLQASGLTYIGATSKNDAYIVITIDQESPQWSTKNPFILAHEIGHVLGCRHQTELYSDNSPCSGKYNHAYCNTNSKYMTIMGQHSGFYKNFTTIPYFSTPNPKTPFSGNSILAYLMCVIMHR